MKVSFREDSDCDEPELLITARRRTPELDALMERADGLDLRPIPGVQDGRTVLLERGDVLRFFTEGKGVSAQTESGTFSVKKRLYELEESLDGHTFVRISNSEIINLKKVTSLDLSLAGTIRVTLAGTATAYVSRRYVKKLKQAVGIERR